ncbi:MAG: MFS transporter, partial [Alphaproteobacteria bacterium]|nr:MFS transporter [Alphaproteobacteria bacterium]
IGVATWEAGLGPITMTLISDYFPRDKRTKPFGVFLSGTHIGGGLALIIGGTIIEMVASGKGVTLPLVGTLKTWQMAFILVGLPGFFILPLVGMIKEPKRHSGDGKFELAEVFRFIRQHWRAYSAIFLGMACIGTVASSINAWGPAMFMRIYGWDFRQIGLGFGSAILFGGVGGSLLAGSVERYFFTRGYQDAKIRVMAICGFLMAPVSFAGILSGKADMAFLAIIITVFLFAMPLVLGPAALMAITPGRLRGQAGAIYIVFIGLLGGFVGPMFVPLLTDFIFHNDAALPYSLATVIGVIGPVGGILLYSGKKYFVIAEKQGES